MSKIVVKKAVVLAAGLGTRLRPFTLATPKPLMPVWGEPMLERIANWLRERGVTDFAFNAHHLPDQVERWAKDWSQAAAAEGKPVAVRVSVEPEILGTGGALNRLRDWLGDEPFYLVNGDIVFNAAEGLGDFPSAAFAREDVIAEALVTEEGPRTIEIAPDCNYVTNWRSDEAGCPGTFTYCGIAVLKRGILDYVPPAGESSVVAAYDRAMMEGKFVHAVQPKDLLWTDAGTVATYLELNRDGDENAYAALPQVASALQAVGLGSDAKVGFIGARGSDRVFFRCEKGVIVVYDATTRGENALYAGHARYLKAKGVSVPEVLADLTELSTLVIGWAGEEIKMSLEQYVKVVEALARFNALGADPDTAALQLMPPMDAAMWKWERELFAEFCLGHRFGREMSAAVREELELVAAKLEGEPSALVHRDFQSTNVLWVGDRLSFIDFQGMRLGPAAYDLASLVYDPYVKFTEGERRALVALYAKKSGRPELVEVLPFAAVERLVQCLGAYGRLASVGQPQFLKHVLPALENLLDAADRAGLEAMGALAEELIAIEVRRTRGEAACSCGHHHDHDHHCEHHHAS